MTEKDDFLSRWSRRKQAAAREAKLPHKEEEGAAKAVDATGDAAAQKLNAFAPDAAKSESVFDLSKLPSLNSIGPDSDIRLFMQPGVPASLSRAALRRAWSADPAIRDFIGLSENAWDFTKPESIPGFGPLLPIDDVKQLLSRILKDASEPAGSEVEPLQTALQQPENVDAADVPSEQLAAGEHNSEVANLELDPNGASTLHCTKNNPAPQQEQTAETSQRVVSRPRHGGALPT